MNSPGNAMMGGVLAYDRFRLLWRRCLINSAIDESVVVHAQLVDSYSEPKRFYHTLFHIEHCLSLLDKINPELQNPRGGLELAIWFHDVVYQPGAKDIEQRSADLCMAISNDIFDDTLGDTVYRHIMATSHDGSEVKNADT